ncbi:hypothetical protein COU59_00605 [Candidatus Pacearchaeota archaeon CG10_big_fil_rev_8_21_14_0_10_34_12]|nr:MAG: hypothetical protein COU59_00605 [Candidatus Pacearchaeota archaeon CG10_big_fil_rev_8_21_14_0_10_34_12]
MGLEDNFHQAVGEWIEHCRNPHVQVSSSSESIRNCDAYRKIISLGKEALPLLRQLYDTDASFYVSGQDEKGEYAAFSTKKLANRQDFMSALFAFQYGETAEESNTGFNQMTQIGREESEKDLPLSIIKGHGLVSVIREIVGDDFSIPEEIRGRISAIEDYTKEWLDKNMHRYVPT